MGSRVHEVLQHLYEDLKYEKRNSLDDLLAYYDELWEKNWSDEVEVIKEGLTPEHYKRVGARCIRDYYRRYEPFDQGRTIATELRVAIEVEGYKLLELDTIDSILNDFQEMLKVDLGLKKATVNIHKRYIKRYLEFCKECSLETGALRSIRKFLLPIRSGNQNTYGNHVKSIRVFFKKYPKSDMAEGFKIPRANLNYIKVPSKEELKRFYGALPDWKFKALFLMYASSGRRKNEILGLILEDVDFEQRMLVPINKESQTKHTWFSFFNIEALEAYRHYQHEQGHKLNGKLFEGASHVNQIFKETSEKIGVKVSPQVLREWFCQTMGELGVPDRFVDAWCGRVPKSVLGKRYTDYNPQRLKQIYDGAGLKVLS